LLHSQPLTILPRYFVIEIFRPGQQTASAENQTYFEFGEQYPILNPTTSTRVHGGQVSNQSTDYITPAEVNFYNGDSYFRSRTIPISETGVASFNVQDKNVVDFYTSQVSSISGRPNIIDIDAKEIELPALIRHSEDVEPNTNINRLNRFLPDNFIDANAGYGAIYRMVVNNTQLEIMQQLKIGYSYIFGELSKDAQGNNVLLTTDKLLNTIRYYQGEYGCNAKSSVVKFNYAIYGIDGIKGIIWRLSQDGLDNLSEEFNIENFSTSQIPIRDATKIIGAFDQKLKNYIFNLPATDDEPSLTMAFSEKKKAFISRVSFLPDAMCCLRTLFISSKNGQLYTHDSDTYNKFYNVQYPSSITLVWNDQEPLKKNFLAIGYQSKGNVVWESPANGDILTSQINSQTIKDQISQLKSVDYELQETILNAGFLRDANSMQDAREALVNGDFLQGNFIITKLVCPASETSNLVNLVAPYITWVANNRNF
jgi:hypothetical protein